MIQRNTFLHSARNVAYPWLLVGCGMLFYCYNYFLRVSPSVMHHELTEIFSLNATELGIFTTLYYLAYTPIQLPAGIIYDKFGPRIVLTFACLTAVIGLSVFISTDKYYIAGMGRFLIGMGGAFSYIGTLKLASIWLPKNRFAFAAGLTTAIGMVSGSFSQTYLSQALVTVDYQQALHSVLLVGVVLSVLIFLLVRNNKNSTYNDRDVEMQNVSFEKLLAALKVIGKNPQMWLVGFIGCLLYLPASVFLDLWGIPYLKSVYHLTASEAVRINTITFYGWIIGGPVIGAISDRIRLRKLPLVSFGAIAAILLCVVFYFPGLTYTQLCFTLFMAGFCCGSHPLCFALGKENNPIEISGTSVAVTNMLIMSGGVLFQPIVGLLLDLHAASLNGMTIYTAQDYTFAVSVVPIGVAIGIFLSLFLKETARPVRTPQLVRGDST